MPWKKMWPTSVKQKLTKDFNLNADQVATLEAYGSLADLQMGQKMASRLRDDHGEANELFAQIKTELQNSGVTREPIQEVWIQEQRVGLVNRRSMMRIVARPWILEPSATKLYENRICTSLPSSLRIA